MKSQDIFNDLLHDVNCKFGAPMGRRDNLPPKNWPFDKWAIPHFDRRVTLDGGGYDKGGAYWGLGEALRVRFSKCGNYWEFYRGPKDLPKRILVQYDIPKWAVCAMVNNDFDGLDKDEADMVRRFQAANMVWECYADLEPEPFFSHHPAFGLPTTCISLNCICEEVL